MQAIIRSGQGLALVFTVLVACGDQASAPVDAGGSNADATPDGTSSCSHTNEPVPTGVLASPVELPLLEGCVAGALEGALAGSWFVRPGELSTFDYTYPTYSFTCQDGPKTPFSDYSWSDGTTAFTRTGFEFGDGASFATAYKSCINAAGELMYAQSSCFRESLEAEEFCFGELKGIGTRYEPLGNAMQNLTLVGDAELPNSGYDVDVKGGVAYVVHYQGISMFDVSTPGAFTLLGDIDLSGSVEDLNDIEVVVDGKNRYAYVAASPSVIVNVTNPAAPALLGPVTSDNQAAFAHTIHIASRGDQRYLYLAKAEPDNIPVYNITIPTTPVFVATIPVGSSGVHDLTVDGNDIYVNNQFDGFRVIDATDFAKPVIRGQFDWPFSHASWVGHAGGRKIAIHGGEGLEVDSGGDGFGSRLRVVDADPLSPTYMQHIGTYASRPQTGIHNMVIHDNKAWIAYYQDGVRVVDLTDPTSPTEIAHANVWDPWASQPGAFSGAIGIDMIDDDSFVLVTYEGRASRFRLSLP